jgi:hypothetical protein
MILEPGLTVAVERWFLGPGAPAHFPQLVRHIRARRGLGGGVRRASADGEAFDAFYQHEFARLAGALRLVTGDRAVAEELAQEAMLRAYRAWPRVSAMDRPGAWLLTVGDESGPATPVPTPSLCTSLGSRCRSDRSRWRLD